MRRILAITGAIVVGVVAAIAPIAISMSLSWRQAFTDESSVSLSYGRDVLRRTEEMSQQIRSGTAQINNAHVAPCSPQEIALMQKIDVGSSYIQAVGRIQGSEIICNSLADQSVIRLGPPTLITANNAEERLNVMLPVSDHPVDVFSRYGLVFLLDPTLAIDVPTEGPDISITIFVPSSANHAIFAARGQAPHPGWFRSIPKGSTQVFRDAGYVVTITRSKEIDIAVITSAPESYLVGRVRDFAYIFVPLGLFFAAVLAGVVTHVARIRLSLPSVLRGAARRKEFFVEYQPIVELSTGRWVGAECLVRWRRGEQLVRPDTFIPVAEESGVITQITACVIALVAKDLPSLVRIKPDFLVAINLSALDLQTLQTVELLKSLLAQDGIRPANIKVEATERGFLQDIKTRDVLASIRALGVEVAIDDFGTGYSSLSCLQTLGLDALKIDKAFVDTIGTDGATSNVVSHIISMAHSLHLTMVAEGVETAEQADYLRTGGVQFAQGWLFGRPMDFRLFQARLQESTLEPAG